MRAHVVSMRDGHAGGVFVSCGSDERAIRTSHTGARTHRGPSIRSGVHAPPRSETHALRPARSRHRVPVQKASRDTEVSARTPSRGVADLVNPSNVRVGDVPRNRRAQRRRGWGDAGRRRWGGEQAALLRCSSEFSAVFVEMRPGGRGGTVSDGARRGRVLGCRG